MSDSLDASNQGQPKRLSAWQLREKMKSERQVNSDSSHHGSLQGSAHALPRPSKEVDPNLPPAFKAALVRERKRRVHHFYSLVSVHNKGDEKGDAAQESDSDSESGGSFASIAEESEDEYEGDENDNDKKAADGDQ